MQLTVKQIFSAQEEGHPFANAECGNQPEWQLSRDSDKCLFCLFLSDRRMCVFLYVNVFGDQKSTLDVIPQEPYFYS